MYMYYMVLSLNPNPTKKCKSLRFNICSHLKRAPTWQRRRWHDAHSRREGIPLTSFTTIVFLLEIDKSSSQLDSVSTWELNKLWLVSFSYDILKGVAALQWSCDLVTAVYCLALCFSDTFPMVSDFLCICPKSPRGSGWSGSRAETDA